VGRDGWGGDAHHVGEGDARVLVLLSDAAAGVKEETVTELHDVSLMDAGDVLCAEVESVSILIWNKGHEVEKEGKE
jgi:hypothetical protein